MQRGDIFTSSRLLKWSYEGKTWSFRFNSEFGLGYSFRCEVLGRRKGLEATVMSPHKWGVGKHLAIKKNKGVIGLLLCNSVTVMSPRTLM